MSDFFIVALVVFVVIVLISFVYIIMFDSEKKEEESLQITSNDLFEQVTIFYKQKKYNLAENLAKKYLEKKPHDSAVRTVLMKILHSTARINESLEQAKILLRQDPKNDAIRIFVANCYVEIGKSNNAITELKSILKSDPNNVQAISDLAKIYHNTNQKKSAITMYKRLEEFTYSNQEKVRNKALVAQMYLDFNEFGPAAQEYNEILEIYPSDIDIKKKLSEVYKKMSKNDLYIEILEEILNLHTNEEDDLWALENLRDAYFNMKDYEKALEYANLVSDAPSSNKVEASENVARILRETGQIDESINILTALVGEDGQNIEIKKDLADSYVAKDDFQSAVLIYNQILDMATVEKLPEIHVEISSLYANWAMNLFEQKDISECFKKFTIALNYYSENPEIYYRLGLVNQSIKNINGAITQLKKAIELDSQNPSYYYSIAECYAEIENIYEEKKALIECIKYRPNSAPVHYKLALIYDSQHETQNALDELHKAIELDSNFVDAKYKLALILELQGNIEGAINLYEQILRINPEMEDAINNLKMLKNA